MRDSSGCRNAYLIAFLKLDGVGNVLFIVSKQIGLIVNSTDGLTLMNNGIDKSNKTL